MKIENIKLFIKSVLNIEEVSDEQAQNVNLLLNDLSDTWVNKDIKVSVTPKMTKN